jgi:hypothetical protein
MRGWAAWWLRARLYVLLALSFAFFYQGGDPNETSRLLLTQAIVERHAVDFTADQAFTIDKSRVGDRYVSDKAPGVSLLSVVPYAAARVAESASGLDHDALAVRRARMHAVVFTVVGLAGVLAALFVRRSLALLGVAEGDATLVTVAFALGSPFFPFATVLYSHVPIAAMLAALFYFALRGANDEPTWRGTVALGALGGAAVVTEYTAAMPVALLGAFLLALHPRRSAAARIVLGGAAGLALPLAVHAIYCAITFGRPFDLPYHHLVDPVFGAGGLSLRNASLATAYGNFLGSFRGLLFFSPVLALVVAGLGFWFASGESRKALALVVALLAAYAIFTCSFYYWEGGMSVGPRHLVPALPFAALPLAYVARRGRAWRAVLLVATAASVAIAFACTAVRIQLPGDEPNPLYDVVLASLARGEVATNQENPFGTLERADAAYNLGTLAGLPARASLLVLPVAWAVGMRLPRRREEASA